MWFFLAVSKGDAESVTVLLSPDDPLATAVPINDNELLEKGFSLRLARKQLSALDEANEGAVQLTLTSHRVETRFTKPYAHICILLILLAVIFLLHPLQSARIQYIRPDQCILCEQILAKRSVVRKSTLVEHSQPVAA